MNVRNVLIGFLVCFALFCSVLVFQSGVFCQPEPGYGRLISLAGETGVEETSGLEEAPEAVKPDPKPVVKATIYDARHAKRKFVTMGSDDPASGFKFKLEMTSKGAAIAKATLSEFDDKSSKDPNQFVLLSPVNIGGAGNVYSFANSDFTISDTSNLHLSQLHWDAGDVARDGDSESVTFSAIIYEKDELTKERIANAVKLTKTYRIVRDSYDVECVLDVENLSGESIKTRFSMQGPAGIKREGARMDMRSIVSAFVMSNGTIESTAKVSDKLRKPTQSGNKSALDLKSDTVGAKFIWAATTNKYFAAILRPVPEEGETSNAYVKEGRSEYFDPGIADKKPSGDEDISFKLYANSKELSAAGGADSKQSFGFQIYLGPKKINLFKDNPLYNSLGYIHTISFMACFCCPEAIINPLTFGIIGLMKTMYGWMEPYGNYGVVIIIFVVLVRFILHPITKKSQVSMMAMQKISSHPHMIEIKKKYADNRAEMQKQTMQFYKDQNVSPAQGIMGMLPMFLQMPIWIALYRAIYANFELRGAAFLPFWITDLSAPDALYVFPKELIVPFLGWHIASFNLLPVLLGVAMFLQQKLMPHSNPSAAQNDQMAQQQKMMMFMMPIMMLLFLYNAPSGLNLYIMASTFAGVFEQVVIRKHIREKEEAESKGLVAVTSKTGGKVKKKKPKPFFKS